MQLFPLQKFVYKSVHEFVFPVGVEQVPSVVLNEQPCEASHSELVRSAAAVGALLPFSGIYVLLYLLLGKEYPALPLH